ncbi:unnamed protein product, partial [Ixodes hexagonus]
MPRRMTNRRDRWMSSTPRLRRTSWGSLRKQSSPSSHSSSGRPWPYSASRIPWSPWYRWDVYMIQRKALWMCCCCTKNPEKRKDGDAAGSTRNTDQNFAFPTCMPLAAETMRASPWDTEPTWMVKRMTVAARHKSGGWEVDQYRATIIIRGPQICGG